LIVLIIAVPPVSAGVCRWYCVPVIASALELPLLFTLSWCFCDGVKIIAASQGEHRVFYWLAAETGLRAGENRWTRDARY
jgi:hypothetical protein